MSEQEGLPGDFTVENLEELEAVISRVKFAPSCIDFGWQWEIEEVYGQKGAGLTLKGWLVNTTFQRPDIKTGEMGMGRGRKEFIAYGSTWTSVVKTCWLLAELIVRHEIMEAFHVEFAGKMHKPFDPHNTLADLLASKLPRYQFNEASDLDEAIALFFNKELGFQLNDSDVENIVGTLEGIQHPWEIDGVQFDERYHEHVSDAEAGEPTILIRDKYKFTASPQRFECLSCSRLFEYVDACLCCNDCHEEHVRNDENTSCCSWKKEE